MVDVKSYYITLILGRRRTHLPFASGLYELRDVGLLHSYALPAKCFVEYTGRGEVELLVQLCQLLCRHFF